MALDIRQLVKRCLAGDQDAMLELVDCYRDQVLGLCYRMLGRRHEAEDVAQETFIRMLRSLASWDSQRDFEPWLLAIAGNRCRTALAARQRHPMSQPLDDGQYVDRSTTTRPVNHLVEEVQLALSKMRPEYREAIVLFHDHQMSYEEIAEVMNRPLGTIKTWIRRARGELIDQLRSREVLPESRNALRPV